MPNGLYRAVLSICAQVMLPDMSKKKHCTICDLGVSADGFLTRQSNILLSCHSDDTQITKIDVQTLSFFRRSASKDGGCQSVVKSQVTFPPQTEVWLLSRSSCHERKVVSRIGTEGQDLLQHLSSVAHETCLVMNVSGTLSCK